MTIADNIDFLNEAKKLFEDIANNPSINETVKTYFIMESLESAVDTMRKYQMFQADYEARLKADVVDMLEQIESEIQEQIAFIGDCEEANGMKRADNLVKDKINALKQSIWQDNYNGKKENKE